MSSIADRKEKSVAESVEFSEGGQERFDNYLASARELEEEQGMEWLEENEPAMWRFLQK